MTIDRNLFFLSAAEQGRMIRDRTISPVDLVQAYLDRIRSYDGLLRAYITVCAEPALAAARNAEREIAAGNWRGPVHGIPYGVKDHICTRVAACRFTPRACLHRGRLCASAGLQQR